LQEAESYLKKNALESGVKVLENGKVQYKIEKEGSGDVVTEETMPTINYNASFSNGQKLGSSEQSGGPIDVNLDETIPGFRKGILGMKVGEKRRIFIHPDMGYGKTGQLPNGLLIFEIEVTKLQPKPEKADDDDDDVGDTDDDDDDLMVDDDNDEVEEVDIEEISIPARRQNR
jgi:peptidylprolyl isomerase